MMMRKNLFFWVLILFGSKFAWAGSLAEQFKQVGYLEICNQKNRSKTFDELYTYFDELVEFLQTNPAWAQNLRLAKESFIRSEQRNYYSTDFFGFYDESAKLGRHQIAFYYSSHLHDFLGARYPKLVQITPVSRFLNACRELVRPCGEIFKAAANNLNLNIYSSQLNSGLVPILLKVVKYLPAYVASRPHYDGTAFSLFLDSTDRQSLLLAPYKSVLTVDDFINPIRQFSREQNPNSILLIPGTLLTEFEIYPTPHIVNTSGKTRYAAIAFAMRPNYISQPKQLALLPNFKSIE